METKPKLPKGKLSMKWVSARNVIQVYLSGRYLDGCNGGDDDEAIKHLVGYYEVEPERIEKLREDGYGYFIK